jgi:hypothetical protein
MYGPTCIFWASLTPFSLQAESAIATAHMIAEAADEREYDAKRDALPAALNQVRDCMPVEMC